ncbi:hypothetical protein [Casimicrobium huifangae]|nr:hypothetical protein [Casimicrobium huifangae]
MLRDLVKRHQPTHYHPEKGVAQKEKGAEAPLPKPREGLCAYYLNL